MIRTWQFGDVREVGVNCSPSIPLKTTCLRNGGCSEKPDCSLQELDQSSLREYNLCAIPILIKAQGPSASNYLGLVTHHHA